MFYYAAVGNISKTQRDCSESFQQGPPHPRTVKSIIDKFEATWSVGHAAGAGRPVSVSTEENQDLLATAITASPHKSVRRLSVEHGLSVTLEKRFTKLNRPR